MGIRICKTKVKPRIAAAARDLCCFLLNLI